MSLILKETYFLKKLPLNGATRRKRFFPPYPSIGYVTRISLKNKEQNKGT